MTVVLVALSRASSAASQLYVPIPQGRVLLIVEGSRSDLDAATTDMTGRTHTDTSVLFDVAVAVDGRCRENAAAKNDTAIRVLELPARPRGLRDELDRRPWDDAYDEVLHAPNERAAIDIGVAGALAGLHVIAVEPEIVWIDHRLDRVLGDKPPCPRTAGRRAAADTHEISACADDHWPVPDAVDWHLKAAELDVARADVESKLASQHQRVKIAHLDTGYTACEKDSALPPRLDRPNSLDFTHLTCSPDCVPVRGDATEPIEVDGPRSRGHGTGTLSILAGGDVHLTPPGALPRFDGTIGGAPFADVVEYRIANFVAYWAPATVAMAINTAVHEHADVISMSMGGPPMETLRIAVNAAYCDGTAMITAAGNNLTLPFSPFSSPRTTVFPARYDRVISAGGITDDRRTYAHAPWRWDYLEQPLQLILRGNVGPRRVMNETIVAFTPNVPWLEFPICPPNAPCCSHTFRLNGAGTSAATPQVAAAAAQWLQYHRDDASLAAEWRSWQKTESVYEALLESAGREEPSQCYNCNWFGKGILRAKAAIDYGVPPNPKLRHAAFDEWDWLLAALMSSVGPGNRRVVDRKHRDTLRTMLRTEVSQLMISETDLQMLLGDLDPEVRTMDPAFTRRVLRRLQSSRAASAALRSLARDALRTF